MGFVDDRPRAPRTLVERLNGVVDRARATRVRLGANPSRVYLRLYRWSGGRRYAGQRELVEERELTPAPEVLGEGGRQTALSGGVKAQATVRLERISPRYTEADLDVLIRAVGSDEEVFVEVEKDGRDGSEAEVRRYRPVSKPERDALRFQWSVMLELVTQGDP